MNVTFRVVEQQLRIPSTTADVAYVVYHKIITTNYKQADDRIKNECMPDIM